LKGNIESSERSTKVTALWKTISEVINLQEQQSNIPVKEKEFDHETQKETLDDIRKTYQLELNNLNRLDIKLSHVFNRLHFEQGNFILAHFGAKRNQVLDEPKGINKIDVKEKYGLGENVGKNFLQHIVNLKADRSFARDDNDEKTANQIDNWFDNFEKSLQSLFNDDTLKLEFDRKKRNFNLISEEGKVSAFTTLSDGYSSILGIFSELIMRMENKTSRSYDIQGIVLIDEIETHLHIDLQKKILPFLTSFFPKIQFIVSTHSPFVLNSINNAVIFDLEKKILVEDMTGYSINSIVESYFDADNYSTVVKDKMQRYEKLSEQDDLSEEQEDELFELKEYFEDLPKMFSPELALKINQIQLANLAIK
jgi:predicted ATP-binding protein involved in virulence